MKAFKKSLLACAAVVLGSCFIACDDETGEYDDVNTSFPSWADQPYNDSLEIERPESLADTYWVRGIGLSINAYGEDVSGYVESIDFIDDTHCIVKMSVGAIPESIKNTALWTDDSNTEETPEYEYEYSPNVGNIKIYKWDDSVTPPAKVDLFTAVAVSGKTDVITVVHFGDIPVQTYLVRGQRPDTPAAAPEADETVE